MKSLSATELNKPRNRRLRKKLRLAEFQELGLEVEATFRDPCPDTEIFLDEWISFVESNDWSFGGGTSPLSFKGFLTHSHSGPGSLCDADRVLVTNWLSQHPDCKAIKVSELQDAWHGW